MSLTNRERMKKRRLENPNLFKKADKKYRNSIKGKIAKKVYRANNRFIQPSPKLKITAETIRRIFFNSNGFCQYCEKPVNEFNFSIDHMVPFSRGGKNVESNLACCCDSCNRKKHTMTVDEFMKVKL